MPINSANPAVMPRLSRTRSPSSVLSLILGTSIGRTPLHEASAWGTVGNVTALLAGGSNPSARDVGGDTPLHLAARFNEHPGVIVTLVEAGLRPNDQSSGDGKTALHFAAQFNANPSVIDVLLDAGADPKIRDHDGLIPWDLLEAREDMKGSDAYWRLNYARWQ